MTLNTKFENCDKWWESLKPEAKMWIHIYFYDIHNLLDVVITNPEMSERHAFMALDKGIECGGSE